MKSEVSRQQATRREAPLVEMILPVHNEKEALPLVLAEWDAMFKANGISYSFIICEDGSNDGTQAVIEALQNTYPIILSQKTKRRGYGQAILDGLELVTADYLLCIDSDGQCDPADFIRLWKQRGESYIITGIRVDRKDTKLRQSYTGLFHAFFWVLFQGNVVDPSSCFLLAPTKIMKDNAYLIGMADESFRWGVCAACRKNNIKILELPINHRYRIAGRTRVFSLKQMPGVVYRGFAGLLKIRFARKK